MNQHLYLRAYMAGITAPTILLLAGITAFVIARYAYHLSIPIERVIIFPMALVPNLFGAWNMLYARLGSHRRLPIGVYGAILPFVIAPLGLMLATMLGLVVISSRGLIYFQAITVPYLFVAIAFSVGLAVYYLLWKYLVAFFNGILGIA